MPAATKSPVKSKKRARASAKAKSSTVPAVPKKARILQKDEELSEEDNNEDRQDEPSGSSDGSDDGGHDDETVDETRLRLAKEYLKVVERSTGAGRLEDDADTYNRDAIAHRLQQDVAEARGKHHKLVADAVEKRGITSVSTKFFRGHKLPITGMSLSGDDSILISSSKDGTVMQWDIEQGTKSKIFPQGSKFGKPILAVAISSDGRYAAMGGKDHFVHVFDVKERNLVQSFKGHRDTVSSLAFRRGSHELFSGSHDRTIKIWNLDEMCYIETLFGHQSEITGLDSLMKERCVSAGRDRTVRLWKVVDESQLIFRGHTASIDCVAMIDEEIFFGGGEDGAVSLWSTMKKKPTAIRREAHGCDEKGIPNWISAVAALKYSDLAASGSCDGFVRLWKCGKDKGSLDEVLRIPMVGFINALAFAASGRFLAVGVAQEHRLGRWQRFPSARNGVAVVTLASGQGLM